MADDDVKGIRERLQSGGEEALGKLAQDLLDNPLVTGAIARAFDAREKAVQAQEVAFNALNIPSAADIERLTRRLRSVSQRLEGIEDAVDRLDERLESIERGVGALDGQLGGLDQLEQLDGRLEKLGKQLDKLAKAPAPAPAASKSSGGGGRQSKAAQKADEERQAAVDARLDEIGRDLAALRRAVAPGEEPPPRAQERLTVSDG